MNISTRSAIVLWLLCGCFLIFTMVVVGGITRLTGSGLSITRWDIVTGTIPPLSEVQWQKEFAHYQESPQYKKINSHFELGDFKEIYWWEYIHRLIGRLIGVVFVVPFTWFLYKGQIRGSLLYKCLLLFAMGGLQGFIGWYMVQSGLVDIPRVSHYRLALHLLTAFATFGLTFWFAFELIDTEKNRPEGKQKKIYRWSWVLFSITVLQIIYGAFVAGLKAGHIYNTWPLMGEKFVADSVIYALQNQGILGLVDNISGVQFVHRCLALLIVAITAGIGYLVRKEKRKGLLLLNNGQNLAFNLVFVAVIIQFTLGVITLLMAVPVYMGVIHQVGAFALFASEIYLLHRFTRKSVVDVKTERSGEEFRFEKETVQ